MAVDEHIPRAALRQRVAEAEQMLRFFMRRDEMNAEVHREPRHGGAPNVRWSPITHAADNVVLHLWFELYGKDRPVSLLAG